MRTNEFYTLQYPFSSCKNNIRKSYFPKTVFIRRCFDRWYFEWTLSLTIVPRRGKPHSDVRILLTLWKPVQPINVYQTSWDYSNFVSKVYQLPNILSTSFATRQRTSARPSNITITMPIVYSQMLEVCMRTCEGFKKQHRNYAEKCHEYIIPTSSIINGKYRSTASAAQVTFMASWLKKNILTKILTFASGPRLAPNSSEG